MPDLYEYLVKDMEERYDQKMHEAVQKFVIRPTQEDDIQQIVMKMPL